MPPPPHTPTSFRLPAACRRDLSDNAIGGQLPAEWGQGLSSVRLVKLAGNGIESELPSEWAQLGAVQHQRATVLGKFDVPTN